MRIDERVGLRLLLPLVHLQHGVSGRGAGNRADQQRNPAAETGGVDHRIRTDARLQQGSYALRPGDPEPASAAAISGRRERCSWRSSSEGCSGSPSAVQLFFAIAIGDHLDRLGIVAVGGPSVGEVGETAPVRPSARDCSMMSSASRVRGAKGLATRSPE